MKGSFTKNSVQYSLSASEGFAHECKKKLNKSSKSYEAEVALNTLS